MDTNLIKEKDYVDNTDSNRHEIRIRSNNVCDEQVSSEPTKEDKEINMQKLLESLSDCV
jgi:hypothetical protein